MRFAPRHSRQALALGVTFITSVTSVASVALASPADAAATPVTATNGVIASAYQYRDGTVRVSGYAWDRTHPGAATSVCVAAHGTCLRLVRADRPSPTFNSRHRLRGPHRFAVTLRAPRAGGPLVLVSRGAHPRRLDSAAISTPGARIVAVARRFVGHARYVEGGASPKQGFDCSGLTLYSYRLAGVATLPHNAEAQRHVSHMRRISRAQARPGDLVFYFAGGPAYHVAIYAGHGMQYAAATPADGIRYQAIWSSSIEFRTDWH